MNDEMRSDAVDRQLAGRHEALIRDLANTLDLDAGLNAALLPGGYADLIEDVRNVLDVDAGLTAIVPRSVGPADESALAPWSWILLLVTLTRLIRRWTLALATLSTSLVVSAARPFVSWQAPSIERRYSTGHLMKISTTSAKLRTK